MMSRLIGYTATILATCTFLFAVWNFSSVVVLILFSLFIASAVRPLISKLVHLGLGRVAAQAIIYVTVFGLIGISITFLSQRLSTNLVDLILGLRAQYLHLYIDWLLGTSLQQELIEQLPNPRLRLFDFQNTLSMDVLLAFTQNLSAVIGGIGLMIVLSLYWSADQEHFERLWLSLLSSEKRIIARSIWRDIEEKIGIYVFRELLKSSVVFILLAILFSIFNIPFALILATFVAFIRLIPLVGGALSVISVFAFGSLESTFFAILGAIFTFIVIVLAHRYSQRSSKNADVPSPLLTLLFGAFLYSALGFFGYLLAPMFAIVAKQFINNFIDLSYSRSYDERLSIENLQDRLADVKDIFKDDVDLEVYPPEIRNLILKLETLLARSSEAILEQS